MEGSQGVLVLCLNHLGNILKSGEHRTFTIGEVFAGMTVFADLKEDFLQQNELVRHKGEIFYELFLGCVPFDVFDGAVKGEDIPQDRIAVGVNPFQFRFLSHPRCRFRPRDW